MKAKINYEKNRTAKQFFEKEKRKAYEKAMGMQKKWSPVGNLQ